MRISLPCMLLITALCAGTGYAAQPQVVKQLAKQPAKQSVQAPKETEVQDSLESIVTNCEKKRMPQDKEVECIEQGYRRFMGVAEPEDS